MRCVYVLLLLFLVIAFKPEKAKSEVGFKYHSSNPNLHELSQNLGIIEDTTSNSSSEHEEFKSPGKALRLSAVHTIAPTLTGFILFDQRRKWGDPDGYTLGWIGGLSMAYGIIVGPAIGQFYGGASDTGGIAQRALGTLIAMGSAYLNVACALTAVFGGRVCSEGLLTVTKLAFFSGSGFTIGSAIYHVITADDVARKHNEELRKQKNLSVAPFYNPTLNAAGLTLTLRL